LHQDGTGGTGRARLPGMEDAPEGEAACWLGMLCPECGAVPEGEGARDPRVPCWRCGAVREADTDPDGTSGS
jgi:hypothetical protein